tara:strand:- start:601 stop:900 length:300 start_codon:yes stop_codon:yes gene_type:complete
MRVKLSYTIDEEDVLSEAAKILNLSADDMNQAIGMFSNVQQELKGENDENKIVNINKCMEMIDDFRQALCNVDTRLQEVTEIIIGYNDYKAAPPVAEEE